MAGAGLIFFVFLTQTIVSGPISAFRDSPQLMVILVAFIIAGTIMALLAGLIQIISDE